MEIRKSETESATKLELMLDDVAASSLIVKDLQMRLGDTVVRCGGIGAVGTKREYRQQGYSRRVIESSLAYMQEEGFHLSALFGIPNYYYKYGFAPAMADCEVSLAVSDMENANAAYDTRPIRDADLPAICEIYALRNMMRSGTIIRDPQTWKGFRLGAGWTDRVSAFVVVDGDDVVGYASYNLDPWRFGIGEVGYRSGAAFSTILSEIARRAIALRLAQVAFHMPPDDPFVTYCRRFGAEVKITYRRSAGGMVRIINQTPLLKLAQPMLERRLAASHLRGWSGVLTLETDLGTDRLVFGEGGEELHVQLPQWMLAQCLMGYSHVQDLMFESQTQVDQRALPLLDAIFPQGYPYMWVADRF